jgi:hypothetical protein
MSKRFLYIDEDSMDKAFVQALKSSNIAAIAVADVGMLHKSDEAQLEDPIA